MKTPAVVFDRVGRIVPRDGHGLPPTPVVEFEGGQTVAIPDGDAGLLAVIEAMHGRREPVYVELGPETGVAAALPTVTGMVTGVNATTGGDYHVRLARSPLRIVVRQAHPDAPHFLARLRDAQTNGERVSLAITPGGHEVRGVRGFPAVPGGPGPVTPDRARELFDLANARSCDPADPTSPCIPFLNPDSMCYARAHAMVRVMLAAGLHPDAVKKVWVYLDGPDDFEVCTPNLPTCGVGWVMHVAPLVEVVTGGVTETWVIDPSLLSGPVPKAAWLRRMMPQGGVPHEVVITDASVYLKSTRESPPEFDDGDYTRTERDLQTGRDGLRLNVRLAGGNPPPYANCDCGGE